MLITSRDTLISLPARLVDLAQLDPGPAAALIADVLRRARPGDPRPQAEPVALGRLAEVCGGLPLALEIVAQILAGDPGLPIACVSEEVENEQTLHLGTARAAFDLSYRRLGREPARLFRLLSLNPGRGVATEAAAALANQSISQTRELLAALARASLLDEQPTGSGWWLMHDLIHVYAVSLAEQDRNGGETAEALDRLLQHYAATANDAVSQLAGQPGQEISDRFRNRADALAWLDRERPNLVAAVKLAADNERATPTASISLNQMAASLALTLVPFLNLRFRFDESLVVSELAVTTARRLDNVEQETQAMLNLGRAQNSLRRFEEALRTNRQVKQMARAVGDRHSEALALGYCGIALQGLLRFDEAIAAYQGSITIFHELGEPTSEAAALNDVGVAQGKMRLFEEAAITYRAAAELSRQAGDRALEASTLVNLGGILVESRHIQEAITAGYEALAIYQELGDKYGEGRAWHNLGIAIRRVQHLEKGAIAVLENAVRSFREAGDLHGAADALNSLGLALAQVRRSRNQAVAAYQQAVELYNETNDRQGAAKALVNLSSALDDLRRSEEAITAAQQALAIFQAVGDRYGEGAALIGLGGALSSARRFEEAITAFEQAQIALRESGDRKGEKLAAYNLAAARTNQKRRALFRGRPFHV